MLIRGIGIPLDKINTAAHQWGIKSNTAEISRIIRQAPGTHLHICKECFTNPSDAHACDLDPRSAVGDIKKAVYDNKKNAIVFDVNVTDVDIKSKIDAGLIKKSWSPVNEGGTQEDDGYVYGGKFDGLTLTGHPAYPEATFNIVHIAEGEDTNDNDTPASTEGDKKPNPLDMSGKTAEKTVTVSFSKEELEEIISNRIAEFKKEMNIEEKKEETPKDTMNEENKKPENLYMTKEQVDALLAEKQADMEKTQAINECRLAAGKLGIKDFDADAMKALPIDQIVKLTTGYRTIAGKIPETPTKSNKPDYYNDDQITGGLNGAVCLTAGYKRDDGTWATD